MRKIPNAEDVGEIMRRSLGEEIAQAARFTTGLRHFVFDVTGRNGRQFVVRISAPEDASLQDGLIYWSALLRPLGIPLPEIFSHGAFNEWRFAIMQRLPGNDLGHVFAGLSSAQRRAIARELSRLQQLVGTLPLGKGFGFVSNYTARFPHQTWMDLIGAELARSRQRCCQAGVVDPKFVDRVEAFLPALADCFAAVRPTPFLDDITTKNVLIADGAVSGIVDVDEVCFGDPLLTIGLTRMALLDRGDDETYIGDLCEYQGFGNRKRELDFYTALHCVDFLSEIGYAFNREETPAVDTAVLEQRLAVLDSLLMKLGA